MKIFKRFLYFVNILWCSCGTAPYIYCIPPDDGNLQAESDSGSFWVLFGGFAPIGKKVSSEDDIVPEKTPAKLYRYR